MKGLIQLEPLFGEKSYLLAGEENRRRRVHLYMEAEPASRIKRQAEEANLTITQYIMYTAVFFEINKDMLSKLNRANKKLARLIRKDMIQYAKKWKPSGKGDVNMTDKDENGVAQFHLRVPQAVYDEIKEKAKALGMNISNYIVFATTRFDIVEMAKKIEEINQKLDCLETTAEKKNG